MAVRILEFLAANTKGKPNEDFLYHQFDRVFAIADGVTRFVARGKKYPNPSSARMASKIFCTAVPVFIENAIESGRFTVDKAEEAITIAFEGANAHIQALNISVGITKETTDYLENDFASCVGVLGVLMGSTLHYGYIGDCGLMVFDKNLLPVLLTQNDLTTLEQLREMWDFVSEEDRKLFWRTTVRNRPEARHLTYGVLNGEEEALSYVKTGAVNLEPGDTAVLFSDGILSYLFDRFVREAIMKALESDINQETKKEIVAQAILQASPTLRTHNFSNLDDDKAFIAFQLA